MIKNIGYSPPQGRERIVKIKANELIGPALDWVVAKCEGFKECVVFGRGTVKDKGFAMPNKHGQDIPMLLLNTHNKWVSECESYPWTFDQTIWRPSTNWSQGGPIIEREHICSFFYSSDEDGQPCKPGWDAYIKMDGAHCTGPTQLIATMRCFVATVLGDEIEVPDALQ